MIDVKLEQEILKLAQTTSKPFYVYTIEQIRNAATKLKSTFGSDVELFYSFKANSHPTILATIQATGLSADVASKGELEAAINAGFRGSQIEFTGPGKTLEELELAVRHDVGAIILESAQELIELERIARRLGKNVAAHVRLNPSSKVNYAGRLQTGEATQFGVDGEELHHFIETLKSCRNVSIVGTHSHAQSQTMAVEHTLQNFKYAIEAAENFAKLSNVALQFANLGGGIGIPYGNSQSPMDLAKLGVEFAALLKDARARVAFAKTKFRVELGRAIVGESGRFVTRVLYTKTSSGKKFAITDGGFTQAQIICGVGQLVRRNLPVHALKRENAATETITVAGPSCYGLDILADEAKLPHLDPGDLLCFENVGAYGYSFSPTAFLRQQGADEFFI